MTLNFMRSKVNSPTLFYGSMLKVVQAPSFLCLLLMFRYLVYLYMFFFVDLDFYSLFILCMQNYIYAIHFSPSHLCTFSCLYFYYFATFVTGRTFIAYLAHLNKDKIEEQDSRGEHWKYIEGKHWILIHLKMN